VFGLLQLASKDPLQLLEKGVSDVYFVFFGENVTPLVGDVFVL